MCAFSLAFITKEGARAGKRRERMYGIDRKPTESLAAILVACSGGPSALRAKMFRVGIESQFRLCTFSPVLFRGTLCFLLHSQKMNFE